MRRAPFCLLKTIQKVRLTHWAHWLGLGRMSKENMGTPLGKLYFLTPLSGNGVVKGISLKWNTVGTGAYGTWRVVDLSKRTQPSSTWRPQCVVSISPQVLGHVDWGIVTRLVWGPQGFTTPRFMRYRQWGRQLFPTSVHFRNSKWLSGLQKYFLNDLCNGKLINVHRWVGELLPQWFPLLVTA